MKTSASTATLLALLGTASAFQIRTTNSPLLTNHIPLKAHSPIDVNVEAGLSTPMWKQLEKATDEHMA